MFPWVYDFEWTAGHLIFLGVFFTAVSVAAGAVALAWLRARRAVAAGEAARVVWRGEFAELPEAGRQCRHAFTGEMPGRVCPLAFDCGECATHAKTPPFAGEVPEPAGVRLDAARYYHRGHAWAEPLANGDVRIGLDDFALRLVGEPDAVEAPGAGMELTANLPAWKVRRNGSEVRIAAPIDGVVTGAGDGAPWSVTVRPKQPLDLRHLLHGAEVRAWMAGEIDRLQIAVSGMAGCPSLADGGVLVDDLAAALPVEEWERICGQMLLEA